MLTLGQCKTSTIANVAQVNVDDPAYAQKINDAVRQLLDLGGEAGWWGTVQAMTGLVVVGAVTWPRKIDAVLAMNLDNCPAQLVNQWYSFTPIDGRMTGWFKDEGFCAAWGPGGHHGSVCEFSGTQPMFAGPTPANCFAIQVTADNSADYGSTVTIYGLDTNGQEIYSNQFDSTQQATVSQRGVQLTLAAAAPVTTQVFSLVTAVTKSVTTSPVRAWSYANGVATGMVGIWNGAQTSPEFLFSKIRGADPTRVYRLSALVKLGYEPVTVDADILCLGNLDAIKSMVQSINAREAGDEDAGDKFEKTAIRRLNMELESRLPVSQMPFQVEVFNGGSPRRRRLF